MGGPDRCSRSAIVTSVLLAHMQLSHVTHRTVLSCILSATPSTNFTLTACCASTAHSLWCGAVRFNFMIVPSCGSHRWLDFSPPQIALRQYFRLRIRGMRDSIGATASSETHLGALHDDRIVQ